VEDPCEHGNEPSGSIKWWEFLRVAVKLMASQEVLSSVELDIALHSKIYIYLSIYIKM
jgi:hypothetical protein